MVKTGALNAAKTNKNDEFYTQYSDISNEIPHYRSHFKGKVVYCNCDDPTRSNFWIYFHNNFKSLGLKKLISTHYQKDTESSYALIYDGGDDFNMEAGKTVEIVGNHSKDGKTFYTAGDFRSDACIELLKEADIVCTNPPFSLFRQYIAQLIEYDKKFIIIGNQNCITYKEVFPLIKENKMWPGYNGKAGTRKGNTLCFEIKDEYKTKSVVVIDGKRMQQVSAWWFTNLDLAKRHNGLWHKNGKFDNAKAHCYYEDFEDNYPKYDNYDAIEVSKTNNIPIDFPGVMGVPITWLDKYNPDEFEILWLASGHSKTTMPDDIKKEVGFDESVKSDFNTSGYGIINGKQCYHRILVRNRNPIRKEDDKGY